MVVKHIQKKKKKKKKKKKHLKIDLFTTPDKSFSVPIITPLAETNCLFSAAKGVY